MESNENPSSMSRGLVSEESSTESDDSFSKTISVSRRKKCIIEDSDSDSSGSFIDVIRKRKRTVNHLISDSDSSSSSSGSEIVRRKRSTTRISSDSDSDCGSKKVAVQEVASSSDSDGQSEKCPICLLTFKLQEVASPEACDHCFCVECIQEWSKNVNTCPVDRQPFNLILVRKNLNGKIIRQIPVQPANQAENDVVVDDPTFCEVCGSSDREDRMLLCDGCDLGYHLECLNPPLDDVPPGVWYCSFCGPEEANQDVNIYLHEVELLLNDAEDMARPNGPRRVNTTRLIPRTRQSERVRARVMTNRTRNRANSEQLEEREEIQVVVRHGASTSTASVSRSRPTTRKKRRKKRRAQPRIKITYEIDEATGEEIRIETKTRRYKKRRKKKRNRVPARPKTVKKRLAVQLGMCRPKQSQQTIPELRNNPPNNSIGFQRYQAGIPSLHLFGREDLLSCSEGEDDYGFGVMARRPNTSDVNALRRNMNRKAALLPPAVAGGTCDILSSIMENQEKLYSKNATLTVKNDGTVLALPKDLNSNENRVDLNDLSNVRTRAAPTYSTSNSSSNANTNVNGGNSEYRAAYSSANQSDEVPPMNSSVSTSGRDEAYEGNHIEIVQNVAEEEKKKNEASESDLDIYSDIETVSTSKEDVKAESPVVANLNLQSDEETNNSDVDLVIDTEKVSREEKEDTEKEKEETVSSTTQIETVVEEDKDEEEDEADGCPNFSIYSTETLNVAKTDLDVLQVMDKTQNSDEVGSSGDVANTKDTNKEEEEPKKDLGLYSDSDDEVVKIDGNKPFGIGDISAMTEDISEEERSYTPCLDEKNANNKEFLDGLDTEAISDEEKNDFDESHEFKTVSDGDALEINAKESELDFTRVEDFEEGEIVDKSKSKKVEEEVKKEENKENHVEEVVKKEEKKIEEKEKDKEKEKEKDSGFKKISKSNKERNYRDKERSKSREKKKDKKKEKRKEIERYNVRSVVAEKPRRMKDKFGRDARRRSSSSRSNSPYRSSSRNRRSYSRSKGRRRRRSRSHSRSRSRRRSRSKNKRRNSSVDRKRRKSRGRSKKRSRSFSPRRRRDWKYSISKSKSPEGRRASPSWTPPRVVENPAKNNLTVILTNDSKKRRDKKKVDKKSKKEVEKKKRKRDKTPPPSKEVFASGDNILVSVSFNEESSVKRNKRDRVEKVKDVKAQRKKVNDLSSVKPVAIIDLDRSPFKELTPSPNDVIVLSDSDNNENIPQENVCDSSQQPENYAVRELRTENYGPKTPPEPQVKFSLNPKATQIRAINNPLHEPDDLVEMEAQAEVEHKGPNTPPEPPNSPPSSPDAYDPFDPTKSRSPTPEKCEQKQEEVVEKVEEVKPQTPDIFKKSHTPPVVPEIQAADSQSNAIATEPVKASPERTIITSLNVTKSTPQTSYSVAPLVTSTPITTNPPRINILNTTILSTPTTSASAIAARNPIPKPTIKISPTKNMNVNKKMNESNESCEFDSPYSPGPSDYEDLFEPPPESTTPAPKPKPNNVKSSNNKSNQNAFDNLFGSSPKVIGGGSQSKNSIKTNNNSSLERKKKIQIKPKVVGVKVDEESLKILDDVPNSAVEMQVKDKFLKKLNRQERVVEEVKLVLKPHYNKKHINKEEYKDILRRSVPKICHNKSGEINPKKIQNLIEAYVKKIRHSKKVTSSSNTINPQK